MRIGDLSNRHPGRSPEAHPQPPPWRRDPARAAAAVVALTVDGEAIEAAAGQSLAVALALAGRLLLRHSPTAHTPRGMFCLMGSCQECVVHVDGAAVLACLEPVRVGMQVELDRLDRERAEP
ncbi:MAG: 2Fe-2S iron-sulfur cluster-binding protein [Acetobacteraceae bacterium]